MKRSLKSTLAFLLAASALITMPACGGSAKPAEPSASASSGNQLDDNVPVSDGEKVKIVVWGPLESYSEAEKASWNFCVEEYKRRYPNVEIESIFSPPGTDYRQQYDKAIMAGNAPTVTNLLPYVDVPTRAANGTIADITPLVENWDLKKEGKVNPALDEALCVDGKWYGIMDYIYLAGTPYNKDTLKAGGADPAKLPATWDEFIEVCKQVTDVSVPRFGYLLLGMEWNAWPFTGWVWSAGGEMVEKNADGTYKLRFTEEPAIDAAELWNKMIWEYKITQKDVLKAWNDLRDDMHSGRGAFAFGRLDHYTSEAETKYGIAPETFGIMPIPAKDSSNNQICLAGGNAWVFSPTATDAELKAAWDFAMLVDYDEEFLLKKWEFENSINGLTDRVSARSDMIDKKYEYGTNWPEGWAEEFAVMASKARPEPFCPHWNDLKNILASPLQTILLTENISRDEIRKILENAADEAYTTYPETFKK